MNLDSIHLKNISTEAKIVVVVACVLLFSLWYFSEDTPTQAGGNNLTIIYLFKADWCPHCQNFMPIWNKMKNKYDNKVQFKTIDSEKHRAEIKKHNIEGFPTIKNNINGEYTGDRSLADFEKWIKTKCIQK